MEFCQDTYRSRLLVGRQVTLWSFTWCVTAWCYTKWRPVKFWAKPWCVFCPKLLNSGHFQSNLGVKWCVTNTGLQWFQVMGKHRYVSLPHPHIYQWMEGVISLVVVHWSANHWVPDSIFSTDLDRLGLISENCFILRHKSSSLYCSVGSKVTLLSL